MDQTELLTLFASPSRQRCQEYALVLMAVGIPCQVAPRERDFALLVRPRDALDARRQLRLYAAENPPAAPRAARVYPAADGFNVASLYGVAILTLDLAQRHRALGLDWWEAGRTQAGLIRDGAWWRAFTALGLHADAQHLLGNLVLGLIFGYLAGQRLGWGLAWAGLILAGGLGNGINALIQPAAHSSVGASTAVFGTLGILAAVAWAERGVASRRQRFDRWVPLGAGIALLAFLGMEGPRTDIVAHVTGFLAGCLFGILFHALEQRVRVEARHQMAAGAGATALFLLAWVWAF